MNDINILVTALISTGTAIVGFLTPLISKYISRKRDQARRLMIGVLNHVHCPELDGYCDFTSYKKAVDSGYKVTILHCRTLSYALRHCDFVIGDINDPKIINVHQTDRIKSIINSVNA